MIQAAVTLYHHQNKDVQDKLRRKERTKILVEGDSGLLERLAEQVERNYRIEVVREPEKSLVMSKARDSVANQLFCLGEILITECTVALNDVHGFGAIIGEYGDRAYKLAVVDAAYRAEVPETSAWATLLQEEERRIKQRHAEEHARILQTKVQFDTKG
jgi:alpha-D-ribose 1-methylphosphonate 5-triphosphate synthase subunit PhnG